MADESKPSGLLPLVRHMIICEDAESSASNPRRTNVLGIFTNVVIRGEVTGFPRGLGFSVYLSLTECRHGGVGRIIVFDPESGDVIYAGMPHRLALGPDPLAVHEIIIRVPHCEIHRPGLYLIEFEFDGVVLYEQSLHVVVR